MQTSFTVLVGLALLAIASAFAPMNPALTLRSGRTAAVNRMSGLRMQEDNSGKRQGASIDADGKSNVWAVEPKMQVEEKEDSANKGVLVPGLIAGGIAILGAILALSPTVNVEQ